MVSRRLPFRSLMARGMGLRERIVASLGSTTDDEVGVWAVNVHIWPALPVRSAV